MLHQKAPHQLCCMGPNKYPRTHHVLTQPCHAAEAPAVKAAPKRRRGGKHRHKGSTTEAGVSNPEDADGVGSAADHTVSHAALSGNLARLQLDRLASNAAAGGFVLLLLSYLLLAAGAAAAAIPQSISLQVLCKSLESDR